MKPRPRILVINSQNSRKDNATGITLRSLLSRMPSDNILEIFRYDSMQKTEENIGFRSIQIPPSGMPLNYCIRKLLGYDNYMSCADREVGTADKNSRLTLSDIAKTSAKAMIENSAIAAPKAFLREVDEFDPELIYTMGSEFYTHKWVLFFANRYNIPIVMHYMDNWRETAFTQDKRLLWLNKKLNRQVCNLENRMHIGLTISQHMAEAYKTKYKHQYRALMHTVAPLNIKDIAHERLHLVYAGGLHLNRNDTLLLVSNAIAEDKDVKLYIYTSRKNREKYERVFQTKNTEFMDAVPHSRIAEIYENADVLLHVESFDQETVDYTKYSLSTKIPEYMICGKPIICFAPKNLASYRCIVESGAGVGIQTKEELMNSLDLLRDRNMRNQFGEAGKAYAIKHFSDDALMDVLNSVFSV